MDVSLLGTTTAELMDALEHHAEDAELYAVAIIASVTTPDSESLYIKTSCTQEWEQIGLLRAAVLDMETNHIEASTPDEDDTDEP